jgi:release factor glutamine methyltransferase
LTVSQALSLAGARLGEAGVPDPGLDAELLLRHVMGWERARIVTEAAADLPATALARFQALVEERARRRPIQHLTGTRHFWRHEFLVTPDVLIPRPETELVVETALALLRDVRDPVVADVGTGSGCIALSLAAERPDAELHAVDASAEALAVARENAARLGLSGRVHFQQGDLLEPLRPLAGLVQLVASNPPYVGETELPGLMPEVVEHEPRLALVPPEGRGPLYRRLATQAAATLKPGGWLVLEMGLGMEHDVVAILEDAGFALERIVPDLAAIPRTVAARKPQ